jgi:preprotein translocase subunit SecG
MGWQMVLGLLLAVYVSLNPVLLESMTFTDTFTVILLGSVIIPFLILPWSTLEALGISVKGVRKDFFLHDGAKARLLQTLVALGTIFLLIRIALKQVGAETILVRFAAYSVVLFLLCALVTFVYFNYFEKGMVARIRCALRERNVPTLDEVPGVDSV